MSLRTSAHAGVAAPRLDGTSCWTGKSPPLSKLGEGKVLRMLQPIPFNREVAPQGDSLWSPRQCAHWLAMTCLICNSPPQALRRQLPQGGAEFAKPLFIDSQAPAWQIKTKRTAFSPCVRKLTDKQLSPPAPFWSRGLPGGRRLRRRSPGPGASKSLRSPANPGRRPACRGQRS